MKIGYSVEGSTDRALLTGLRDRWCPGTELVEGHFRGKSGQSQRREIPGTCRELAFKGVDFAVFMRDANDEDWRGVLKADQSRCRPEHEHLAVFVVCGRNVECWLCADPTWLAARTDRHQADFTVDDPKGAFESALQIKSTDRKEPEIAALVKDAPLRQWLRNKSFEAFYDELWRKSKGLGCQIENLRENTDA
ncbi:MAG: hypothetical protein HY343_00090 [Lentisphaerae bacterium]|nr:hypothetical protein [Lentisphaerota bacterium]